MALPAVLPAAVALAASSTKRWRKKKRPSGRSHNVASIAAQLLHGNSPA